MVATSLVAASAQTTIDDNMADTVSEHTLPDDGFTEPRAVRGGEFRNHEIGVGYGLYTGPQLLNLFTEILTFSLAKVDLRSSGAVSASYLYYPIKHVGVGGTVGYQPETSFVAGVEEGGLSFCRIGQRRVLVSVS